LAIRLGPMLAFLFRGVVSQPDIGIAAGVRTVPMEVIGRQFDFLFAGGEDVAIDYAVQLAVGEVIGEVENDPLVVELVDHIPEDLVEVLVAEDGGSRWPEFGIEPSIDGQNRGSLPGKHGSEKLILDRQRPMLDVHTTDRFVVVRFQFIAKLCVAEEFLDFVGTWMSRIDHGKQAF
jgi:hypothetical protein